MRLKSERRDRACLGDQFVHEHVCSVAGRLAARAGLPYQDQQDFAGLFGEQMCCHRRSDLHRYQQGHLSEGWLIRCAEHAISNYRRSQAVIRRHEIPLPQIQDENGNLIEVEFVSPCALPEIDLLQKELRQRIEQAIATLEPPTAALFLRRHVDGCTLAELAEMAGGTEDAVRKRLARSRAHVRAQLQRRGFDAATANEYLSEIADRPMRGGDRRRVHPRRYAKRCPRKKLRGWAKSPVRFCRLEVL